MSTLPLETDLTNNTTLMTQVAQKPHFQIALALLPQYRTLSRVVQKVYKWQEKSEIMWYMM